MDNFIIQTSTSYQAADATIALIKAGFKATKAQISYNKRTGLPPIHMVDSYPLTLEGTFNGFPSQIKVWAVTAGYGGSGPHDLLKILKAAGFEIDDTSPILTEAWTVNNKINITCTPDGKMTNNLV